MDNLNYTPQTLQEGNEREHIIDIAKGIGILLVVLGHLPSLFSSPIYLFHMPFFFIISGYCLSPRHYYSLGSVMKFAYNRFVALILPIIIAYAMIYVLKRFIPYGVDEFIEKYHLMGTFWFLKDLFKAGFITVSLMFFLSLVYRYKRLRLYTALLFLIVSIFIGNITYRGIGIAMYISVFYVVGHILREERVFLHLSSDILNRIIAVGVCMLIVLSFSPLCSHNHITKCDYEDYIPYTIAAFAGSYLCWQLSHVINKYSVCVKSILCMLGKNTMPIVLFQWLSFCFIDLLSENVIHIKSPEIVWISKFVAGITIPLLFYKIYRLSKVYVIYKKLYVKSVQNGQTKN